MSAFWDDEQADAVHCRCTCHGIVELNESGQWRSYINCPPRLDNPMGWAESCSKCEVNHWIAASVRDQVVSSEADMIDDANVYAIKYKRTK